MYSLLAPRLAEQCTAKAAEHRVTGATALIVMLIEECQRLGDYAVCDRLIAALQLHRQIRSEPLPLTKNLVCTVAQAERRMEAARDLELADDTPGHRRELGRRLEFAIQEETELRTSLAACE